MDSVPPVLSRSPVDDPVPPAPRDADQETDVWWGAYAGRTMLPGFALCGLATVATVIAAWLGWRLYEVPELWARYLAYAVIGPVWIYQLGHWCYRILTRTYRLTTHRLFLERTFFHVPARVVPLDRVTEVEVGQTRLDARLNVGRLWLRTEMPDRPAVVLEGVYEPRRVAGLIRELAGRRRGGKGAAGAHHA